MKLEGKVAIVTGASSGMGAEIARIFAREGAQVLALARRAERLEELKETLKAEGYNLETLAADVSVEEDIKKATACALELFGKIDILVNNAGVLDDYAPVGGVKDEVWDRTLLVNVYAPMRLMREVIPTMQENGSGCIINIASVGGLHGARGGAAYVTSKHALIGLSRNTGFMYADQGIRCNALCPGAVETEISSGSLAVEHGMNMDGAKKLGAGMALNPRSGQAVEIATAALFLASDDSSFVNGTELIVDGGWTAY